MKLIPMADKLAELGRKLEQQGKIIVEYGDDYSEAALPLLLDQNK